MLFLKNVNSLPYSQFFSNKNHSCLHYSFTGKHEAHLPAHVSVLTNCIGLLINIPNQYCNENMKQSECQSQHWHLSEHAVKVEPFYEDLIPTFLLEDFCNFLTKCNTGTFWGHAEPKSI